MLEVAKTCVEIGCRLFTFGKFFAMRLLSNEVAIYIVFGLKKTKTIGFALEYHWFYGLILIVSYFKTNGLALRN